MFCSRVLAETPESVDSIGRFVTAAYLYHVRNSFAHFVCAKIADELKFFQAKSLKLVFPIEYPQDLIERFVCHLGSGDRPSLVDQAPIEILSEDFARLPDQVQPPRHWVDAHGRTEGCSSCATRQGRHSKKCCERYWNWIRNQKKGEVPALPDKPEEQPPQMPNYTTMVQDFLGTLQLPIAIYVLDYYLPMLSPNEGYNETGLTMQSAGPVREHWQPIQFEFLFKGSDLAIGKLEEDTMHSLSGTPAWHR